MQVDAESSEDAGYAAARTLLERGAPFDAVFACSDVMASAATQVLHLFGRPVPVDDAIAVATAILPGALATNINLPASPKAEPATRAALLGTPGDAASSLPAAWAAGQAAETT